MKDHKRAMLKGAELLERQALAIRGAHMRWNGSAYTWPATARAEKRLHDHALDHAGRLRELTR